MIDQIVQLIQGKNSKSFFKILSKYPLIVDWVDRETQQYSPSSFNEKLYILLVGPPVAKPCGKFPVFSSYQKGYRSYCGARSVCECINSDHSKSMIQHNCTLSHNDRSRKWDRYRKTNLAKYGVANPAQHPSVKEKTQKTNQARYGADSPLESSLVQKKIQETNLKKYGVAYPLQSKQIQEKSRRTAVQKYGLDYMKIARTAFLKNNNGVNPFVVHQQRVQNSVRKKFGVDHPLQNQHILNKSQTTLLKNHGVRNPAQLHIPAESYALLEDKDQFTQLCKTHSVKQLAELLGVSNSVIWNRHDLYELDCYSRKSRSQYEEEIAHWLDQYSIGYRRNHKINNKTVDFLIQGDQVAIEFNGLYAHSENSHYGKLLGIDSQYHHFKYASCRQQNIKLFTIFEDEWNRSKDIIKNRILIACGQGSTGVAARKCSISSIDRNTAANFLDQYHLQGSVNSSVYLGAYHQDHLIAVMTFKVNAGSYELTRFASDSQIHPGVFSKMLAYFERQWPCHTVYSFSDNRWGWGEVYAHNGFVVDAYLKPDYFVTNYQVREHKFNWRKSRIQSRFDVDVADSTELELIRSVGWDRIWDCGKIKWVRKSK